ncbi:MupA/Atu3671 family FMN-dependent luciferase-like monooxygenase [Salinispora oceanensis]|uniref:MupA/Atu3671 family FMN-dependent luciferase-like monooxygenase n=1 Tax=Salinispora oceanensis TaxID=1050199 RepID=UPI000371BD50|nr:MupA/Atu3671 family FMN-dependent luciferase-like monooxygenase [Salinispora oceanensis]
MTDTVPPADGSSARRALLAERLRQRARRSHPLSYPQQRLWFLDQLDPENPVYNIPLGWRVSGPLDVPALEWALTELVRRHEALRTVFRTVDGQPRQVVAPAAPIRIAVADVDDDEEMARREARTGFDLTTGPLLRVTLLRVGPTEHRLCLTVHHIACDGWSIRVLEREISALYRLAVDGTPAGLDEPVTQYADFAEWQVAELRDGGPREVIAYWHQRLRGVPDVASLPTDRPRPPTQTYRGGHLSVDLPGAAAVAAVGRPVGATPYAVLLAAFAVLVRTHTGGNEVVVGSPVAGRLRPELDGLVGFFANTLVQRLDVTGRPTFRELVCRARDESRAAVAHQELPFELLVEQLHPNRDLAHNPLFQVLFSYHEADPRGLELTGARVRPVPGDSGTAKFDLSVSVTRVDDVLSARIEYSEDLYERGTAGRLADGFRTVLAAGIADPDLPIDDLPVLTPDERRRMLVDWNDTAAAQPPDTLVHELFARRVAETPGLPVLREARQAPEEALTYRQLDERAERLAARLRAVGVGPDVPVGVFLDRGVDLVVTLLGILQAGGAYLPLDPTYPVGRLSFMVADSGTPVVVTHSGLGGRLEPLPVPRLLLDDVVEATPGAPAVRPRPENLAYLTYTSGSTGRPKGVLVTHRNVGNFFVGMDAVLGAGEPGTWLAVTSVSFDISVLELLWTLARGHRVVLRADERQGHEGAVPAEVQARHVDFSLFYFGGDDGADPADRYRLLLDGARFADRNGFAAVWTPERHFHEFGGLYPNPAVTGAAVAAVTERVAVRAGSVVLPLHDPLRVAEEWAVLDNISHGRAGISIASGWQPTDFALAPEHYADRKARMVTALAEVRRLWAGETVTRRGGTGAEVRVGTHPRPVQERLPVWVTSARNVETFELAGQLGAGLLTHLLGHTVEELAGKIEAYRRAWRAAGHDGDGHVALMVHTFVDPDTERVRKLVREPLKAYIQSSFDLLSGLGAALGRPGDFRDLPADELAELVERAFDRFFDTAALLGAPERCADTVDRLKRIGVDEIACLVDFGVPHGEVLASLEHLAGVRRIVTARRAAALDDEPIGDQLRRCGITHLQCTPSLAGVLADDPPSRATLGDLRHLLVGGEALPAPLAASLAAAVPGSVHNMYGPTEATVWATTDPVRPDGGPVTIGRPLANTRAYVVDARLRPVPLNAPGELLIGGEGVARGYHRQPGLTAERFVPDPYRADGSRLYRTGDLARWRPDGRLEFLGRIDAQVKIHGHRIELGEIENVIAAHPQVRSAVVLVRGEGAHATLVAYCVPAADSDPQPEHVRTFARESLPEYMVPARVVLLAALPVTPNGKVDRGRLPDGLEERTTAYRPPRTDLERIIADVWAELLGRDRIGADDHFFSVGGNSLLAVQARSRLLARGVAGVSLVDIFRYPTLHELAASLTAGTDALDEELDQVRRSADRRTARYAATARHRRERSS